MSWRQVPAAPPSERRPGIVAGVVTGVVPLAVETTRLRNGSGWWLVLVAVGAAAVATARRWPRFAPAVAAATFVVLASAFRSVDGVKIAAMAAIALSVASVATGAVAWRHERLRGGAAFVPAMAPVLAADLVLLVGPNLRLPAALLGIAAVAAVAATVAPAPFVSVAESLIGESSLGRAARRVGGAVERFARFVGRVLLWVSLVPAAVVTLVVWVLHRLVGHDPLRSPARAPGGWVVRSGDDPHPDRYHSSAPIVDERPFRVRLAVLAPAVVLVVVLVAGGVSRVVGDSEPPPPLQVTAALPEPSTCARSDDVDVLDCETSQALSRLEFYPPAVYRLADFRGTVVNQRDGVRRTWRPPDCECRRLTVWWFGGSAAWGEGQRDGRTIASMLARRAHANGVVLDVVNFGQPTYTLGQEVRTFADLTTRRRAPDLVVFYGGGNDLLFQAMRAGEGRATDDSPIVLSENELSSALRNGFPLSLPADDPAATDDGAAPPPAAGSLLDQVVDTALDRYSADADLARRIAESIDRTAVVVFQPLLAAAPVEAGRPDALAPGERGVFEQLVDRARERLPRGTIDLSDVFDDDPKPVFRDLFHTDEVGAAVVADALFEHLLPRLRSVQLER